MNNTIITILTAVLITSCAARQEYKQPTEVATENLFRTDSLTLKGSSIESTETSIATTPWKEIFTDSHLQNLISKGLENNLDVLTAVQNIASAEAYLKQYKASVYEPTLSLVANFSYQTPSLNSASGQGRDRTYLRQYDLTASLSWEADIWGKLNAQKKAQLATYLSTVAAQQAVKSTLVASLATAYFQLLTYDKQKQIIEQTIELRQKNLETTKALKSAGSLTEVAVKQSEALVYNAQASLISIENQIVQLENSISLLLGEAPHKIERGSIDEQVLNINTSLGYPSHLLTHRPDVRKAELDLRAAFELTNVANAQFYPSLKITANGGLQSLDIDKLFSTNSLFASIIAGLTQPLLNKRQIRTNYEVSLANKEKAYLAFRKAVLTAGKEVSDALKIYSSQEEFISLKKKELEAYTHSVDYSRELVNYGMANYLEVLNADVNKLNAELNILNAQYIKLQSGVELYRALGAH
ncbi:efflux transporter outer membrane subunit [Bergeyella cardium]|uniref:Efflux transporter outer membrane subunit n=1 Tax=Bergeyella cardium TaxID=1585976 RepID=A0A6P1QW05_9FLAO|nr:efflux transporter outer membrane subunit [Bergeyella cardium]QHN65979.1 efflux transporter outer membrane subunit [Bergeyella cardium]WHE33584.1 efflux transporter outer membrane subunit [Bergeyella cardium]WHF60234.1 efflux transporter outer membrane subunit [Bergeyella cardium]